MRISFVFFILYSLNILLQGCKESDRLSETDEGKKKEKRHVPGENTDHLLTANMEDLLSHKWSQLIEGKEFINILPLLKTNKELFCVLSAQKKEDKSYDITLRYYDGGIHTNTIRGAYRIDRKGELIAENNSPEIAIKKQEDHHISFKVNGHTLSFQGKPVRFFKTPVSIDHLRGIWRARSLMEGGKREDFVSADLAGWNISQKVRDKYFQNRNRRIRDRDYSLEIFTEPTGNLSNPSSGYGGFFTGGLISIGFRADQKPALSQGNNSILVKHSDGILKRIYILNYDSSQKTITTLTWWSYEDLYIKNPYTGVTIFENARAAPDDYSIC